MKYVDVQFTHINNLELMYDLINFEQKFLSPIKKINIGITYFDDNMMNTMQMLQKSCGKFHNDYMQFLNVMNIPFPNDIDNVYDDVYNDVEIKWFNAMEMEDDSIRQYIGNLQFLIIYDNGRNPMEIEKLTIFGKMVQFFIIVKKVGETDYGAPRDSSHWTQTHHCQSNHSNQEGDMGEIPPRLESCVPPKYSLGFVRKTLQPICPMIPFNHLFDQSTLRDFILTKAYNSLISLKYDSNLSIYHSYPATIELKRIAQKYL